MFCAGSTLVPMGPAIVEVESAWPGSPWHLVLTVAPDPEEPPVTEVTGATMALVLGDVTHEFAVTTTVSDPRLLLVEIAMEDTTAVERCVWGWELRLQGGPLAGWVPVAASWTVAEGVR